jgi:hypothetical protein
VPVSRSASANRRRGGAHGTTAGCCAKAKVRRWGGRAKSRSLGRHCMPWRQRVVIRAAVTVYVSSRLESLVHSHFPSPPHLAVLLPSPLHRLSRSCTAPPHGRARRSRTSLRARPRVHSRPPRSRSCSRRAARSRRSSPRPTRIGAARRPRPCRRPNASRPCQPRGRARHLTTRRRARCTGACAVHLLTHRPAIPLYTACAHAGTFSLIASRWLARRAS